MLVVEISSTHQQGVIAHHQLHSHRDLGAEPLHVPVQSTSPKSDLLLAASLSSSMTFHTSGML